MGLSGPFRTLCFPLWLGVESRILEIVGLESGSGLTMGDITVLEFPRKPLMRRETVETYPPFFLERIWCLAGLLGESCNSGYDPGLMSMAKSREIFGDSRRIFWAVWGADPKFEIRA